MRKNWRSTVICLLIISIYCTAGESQPLRIFQVVTAECPSFSSSTTGFQVKGLGGIVTTLHGVVGCGKISAFVGGTTVTFKDLRIISADIGHDVALLYSSDLDILSVEGFFEQEDKDSLNYEGLNVIGYPLELPEPLPSTLKIRTVPRVPLEKLIPSDAVHRNAYSQLKKRGSPDLNLEVLSIEGHLQPGHSGAPILNQNNKVVGVANGGLGEGKTEIVWAIPWHDIIWKNYAQIEGELQNLAQQPTPTLFNVAKTETIEFFDVWYTDVEYGFFSVSARNTEGGILKGDCALITYERGGEIVRITDIKKVSHVKMSGDIEKAWVKVEYGKDSESIAFLADGKKAGLITLIGGSFEIFDAISKCVK